MMVYEVKVRYGWGEMTYSDETPEPVVKKAIAMAHRIDRILDDYGIIARLKIGIVRDKDRNYIIYADISTEQAIPYKAIGMMALDYPDITLHATDFVLHILVSTKVAVQGGDESG